MMDILIIINAVFLLILLFLVLSGRRNQKGMEWSLKLDELNRGLGKLEQVLREEFRTSRDESNARARDNRTESSKALADALKNFGESFDRNVKSFNDLQREKFSSMEQRQGELIKRTEEKLNHIRETVDEKLQKTLSERLDQSFNTVGKQLIEVQKGLGEMQTLAQDVGGLKKVLGNVKMRGGLGEIQLSMLLEQILAPDQYARNVKTNPQGREQVEFALKLPGKEDSLDHIWLPIDAKFPKDIFEHLQNAYETGDVNLIEPAQKNLHNAVKKMARDICDKYVAPPFTTDFAIMFLPFEGIYAEVVRKASLIEEIQRECHVVVTGPSTLAAILHSLQMGFRTLAIQKRSSEVWQVLSAVKNEFANFGGMLTKAQNNIQTGLNQLDEVVGTRTRAIQRKLRNVENIPESTPELTQQVLDLKEPEEEED